MDSSAVERDRRHVVKLRRECGPELIGALEDPTTIEISINPDGWLWVEPLGHPAKRIVRMQPSKVQAIISTVAAVLGRVANVENPILEGELPLDGSRFQGLLPPIVVAPSLSIRKRASSVFTLEEYVRDGIMTTSQRLCLEDAVASRKNILIVGGTSSGKTTLTNAVIQSIVEKTPDDRLILIEDTYELQCNAKNCVPMHASDSVSMDRLLRAALRLRPDRILVGEVRGAEALALLKAWNTGHPGGVATLHANSPLGALTRLEQLTSEGSKSTKHLPALISEAIDLIVFIERTAGRRAVSAMANVMENVHGRYQIATVDSMPSNCDVSSAQVDVVPNSIVV